MRVEIKIDRRNEKSLPLGSLQKIALRLKNVLIRNALAST